MKRNILITGLLLLMMGTGYAQTTFYDLTIKDINGEAYSLSQLKSKKVLVVNTAGICNYYAR